MVVPCTTGSGASVLPMISTGLDATVVVIVAPAVAAVSLQPMLYFFLMIRRPPRSALFPSTTLSPSADAPAARFPMFQVTTPAASVPPPVALTKLVFAGTVSLITTPVALELPRLEYMLVQMMFLPAFIGSGESVLLMFSAGADDTVGVIDAPFVVVVSLLSMF